MKQLPPPPREHEHELKMEKRLRRMLREYEQLSEGELRYYSRQMMLDDVGYEGQLKLKKATVCLVGLGGLGSVIAMQLAAMGVGHLWLVDRDVVEESNLQRQYIYDFDAIGYPKVEAAAKRLEKLNPYGDYKPVPLSFNEHNAIRIIGGASVVVDGLDNMNTRYAVNRACVKRGIPYIFGSAISTFGNVSSIIPRRTACLECFYGNLDDTLLPSCGTIGVHPSIIAIVASIEAAETVKILLDKPPSLADRLFYCDISSTRFETIHVARAENCPICGGQPRAKPLPLKHALVEEGCGRNKRRVFTIIPKEDLNIDFDKLTGILRRRRAQVTVRAKLGVAFTTKSGIVMSLLKSGIMIIEGAKSDEEARQLHRDIVVKNMRISRSRIE